VDNTSFDHEWKKYIRKAPYIHEKSLLETEGSYVQNNNASILRSDGRTPILANPWTRCCQNWLILTCFSKDYLFRWSRLQCVFATGHPSRVVVQERSFQFKNNERKLKKKKKKTKPKFNDSSEFNVQPPFPFL
jgi:hypothetical protein